MAVIGEASAILSTIQIGLSLAKTLYACVGEYKNAREDIISLATDVEATLTQAQELERLISSADASQILNERGLKLARKCSTDSERVIIKLLKLLAKAGISEGQTHNIKPDDIDVSKFRRATWVFVRSEVLEVRRELDSIKLSALFARSCIEAKSATSADDRDAAASRIVGLQRSRRIAQDRTRLRTERGRSSINHSGGKNDHQDSAPVARKDEGRNVVMEVAHGHEHSVREAARGIGDESNVSHDEARALQPPTMQSPREHDSPDRPLHNDLQRSAQLLRKSSQSSHAAPSATGMYPKPPPAEGQGMESPAMRTLGEHGTGSQEAVPATKAPEQPHRKDSIALYVGDTKLSIGGPTDINAVAKALTSPEVPEPQPGDGTEPKSPPSAKKSKPPKKAKADLGRYVHLLLVITEDEGRVIPWDNQVFSHEPCGGLCDPASSEVLWTSIPTSDRDAVLEYVEAAYALPKRAHWQLHAAWQSKQPAGRRRTFMDRILLRSKRLAQPGESFTIVFANSASQRSTSKPKVKHNKPSVEDLLFEGAHDPPLGALPVAAQMHDSSDPFAGLQVPGSILDLQSPLAMSRRQQNHYQPAFPKPTHHYYPRHSSPDGPAFGRQASPAREARRQPVDEPRHGVGTIDTHNDMLVEDNFPIRYGPRAAMQAGGAHSSRSTTPASAPASPNDSQDDLDDLGNPLDDNELREKLLAMYTN